MVPQVGWWPPLLGWCLADDPPHTWLMASPIVGWCTHTWLMVPPILGWKLGYCCWVKLVLVLYVWRQEWDLRSRDFLSLLLLWQIVKSLRKLGYCCENATNSFCVNFSRVQKQHAEIMFSCPRCLEWGVKTDWLCSYTERLVNNDQRSYYVTDPKSPVWSDMIQLNCLFRIA